MNRIEGKLITGFEDNALEAMRAYGWPGNVRELENAVERVTPSALP
jgi:DNA-binding NtrC family response regulator